VKDSQRGKAYKAEFAVRRILNQNTADGAEHRWDTIAEVQAYGDGVCQAEGQDLVRILRTDHRNAKQSFYVPRDREIYLAEDWALRSTVVLHELAHAFTDRVLPSHGGEWAETFLSLLTEHSGPGHASYLRTAYDRCGVTIGRRPAAALKSARAIASKTYCNGVGDITDPWIRAVYLDTDGVSLIDSVARLIAADRTGVTIRPRGSEVAQRVAVADLCYVRRS